MTKKIISGFALISTLAALLSVTGCNTVAGAGTDVERAGSAIHNKAEQEKND